MLYRLFTKTEVKVPLGFLTIHVVVFLLALTSSAFGFSADKKSYRIGLGPWVGFGPLYLAKENEYFDEAGLDVDLIVLTVGEPSETDLVRTLGRTGPKLTSS